MGSKEKHIWTPRERVHVMFVLRSRLVREPRVARVVADLRRTLVAAECRP